MSKIIDFEYDRKKETNNVMVIFYLSIEIPRLIFLSSIKRKSMWLKGIK
jgi:hypothetical protein